MAARASLTLSLALLASLTAASAGAADFDGMTRCSSANVKALKVFNVGQASLFRADCAAADPLAPPMRLAFRYNREVPGDAFAKAAKSRGFATCQTMIGAWQQAHWRSYLVAIPRSRSLLILDTRPARRRLWHRLTGVRRQVFELCDATHTARQISDAVDSLDEAEAQAVLQSFLATLALPSQAVLQSEAFFLATLALSPQAFSQSSAVAFLSPQTVLQSSFLTGLET